MTDFKGVVVRSTGSWYSVKSENGDVIECRLRGKFRMEGMKTTNPVAVGDVVLCKFSENEDVANIFQIEPRKNCLIRKSTNMSRQRHILAANIDLSLIIATVAYPRTSTGFIDRSLVSAEAYNVPSAIVFNKLDLCKGKLYDTLKEYKSMYETAGYTVLEVSATQGTHLEDLKRLLENKTCLLTGHSGVGKSHLINSLDPTVQLKTGAISEYHQKGKHTTTFAEMYQLGFGAAVIDTPGIKEFGLVDFEKWELGHWFPEFTDFISLCRFHNCTHEHEPGCSVRIAVEEEKIHIIRYKNYLSILNNVHDDLSERD